MSYSRKRVSSNDFPPEKIKKVDYEMSSMNSDNIEEVEVLPDPPNLDLGVTIPALNNTTDEQLDVGSISNLETGDHDRNSLLSLNTMFDSPVDCWNASGDLLLKSFPSVQSAAEALAVQDPQDILDCMNGDSPLCVGLQWRQPSSSSGDVKSTSKTQVSIKDLLLLRQPLLGTKIRPVDAYTRRIECYNLNGSERMNFPNVIDASRFFKIDKLDILDVCFGDRTSLRNRKWKLVGPSQIDADTLPPAIVTTQEFYRTRAQIPVDCFSFDNVRLLKRFESSDAAGRVLGITTVSDIVDCALGRRRTINGFRFRFSDGTASIQRVSEELSDEELLKLRKPPLHPPVIIPSRPLTSTIATTNAETPQTEMPRTEMPLTETSLTETSRTEMPLTETSLSDTPLPNIDAQVQANGSTVSTRNLSLAVRVDCYSLDGEKLLFRFRSLGAIRNDLHVHKINEIIQCCNGLRETSMGFRWKYYDASVELDPSLLLTLPEVLLLRVPPYRTPKPLPPQSQPPSVHNVDPINPVSETTAPSVPVPTDLMPAEAPTRSQPIDCFCQDGSTFLRRFISANEVIRELRIAEPACLYDHLQGATPDCVGFLFKLADTAAVAPDPADYLSFPQIRSLRIPSLQTAIVPASSAVTYNGKTSQATAISAVDEDSDSGDSDDPDREERVDGETAVDAGGDAKERDVGEADGAESTGALDEAEEDLPEELIDLGTPTSRRTDAYGFPVDCWSLDGKTLLRRFPTLRSAKAMLRLSEAQTRDAKYMCNGQGTRTSVVGFLWRHVTPEVVLPNKQLTHKQLLLARKPPFKMPEELTNPTLDKSQVFLRPVETWNLDGTERMLFNSSNEGAAFFKVSPQDIVDCCYGARNYLRKRKWVFAAPRDNPEPTRDNAVESIPKQARLSNDTSEPQGPSQNITDDDAPVAAEDTSLDTSNDDDVVGAGSTDLAETSSVQDDSVYFGSGKRLPGTPVDCWSLDGTRLLRRFRTITDALESLQLSSKKGSIKNCCHGKAENAHGFVWKFRDETIQNVDTILPLNQLILLRDPPLSAIVAGAHKDGHDSDPDRILTNIDCWTLDGIRFLRRFRSFPEISRALNTRNLTTVRQCYLGERDSAHGFQWRVADPALSLDGCISVAEFSAMKPAPIPVSRPMRSSVAARLEAAKIQKEFSADLVGRNGIRNSVPVEVWSLDGTRLLRRFQKMADALELLEISRSAVVKECCEGRRQHAFGFTWRFTGASTIVSEQRERESEEEEVTDHQLRALRVPSLGSSSATVSPQGLQQYQLYSADRTEEVRNSDPVDCWGLAAESKLMRRFSSVGEAVRVLHLTRRSINYIKECMLGQKVSAFGFVWKIADDELEPDEEMSNAALLALRDPPLDPSEIVEEPSGGALDVPPRSEGQASSKAALAVDAWSRDGTKLLRRFSTTGEALHALDLPRRAIAEIRECCNGVSKSAYGFVWKFMDPSISLDEEQDVSIDELCQLRVPPMATDGDRPEKMIVQTASGATAVDCWTLDGSTLLRRFGTMTEALRALRLRTNTTEIKNCCLKTSSSAYGFKWAFRSEAVQVSGQTSNETILEMRIPPYFKDAKPEYFVALDNSINTDDPSKKLVTNPGRAPISVDCLNVEGSRILHRFVTITHALKALQIPRFADIKDCITGSRESSFGFKWKYVDQEDEDVPNALPLEQLLALRDPPLSIEHIEDYRPEVHMGGRTAVPIDCWSLDGTRLLRRFASMAEVRETVQLRGPYEVRECCLGNRESAFGYKWKFMDKSITVAESEQLSVEELLLLRDPPLSRYSKTVSFRDHTDTAIDCFGTDGNFIVQFESAREVSKVFRIDQAVILDCCYGLIENVGYRKFAFADSSYQRLSQISIDCIALNGETIHKFINDAEAAELLKLSREDIATCCIDSNRNVAGLRFRYSASKDLRMDRVQSVPRNVLSKVYELGGVLCDTNRQGENRHKIVQRRRVKIDRDAMSNEGWLFNTQDSPFIGVYIRRFTATSFNDGYVEAFLPGRANAGTDLWHLRLSAREAEDVERDNLLLAMKYRLEGVQDIPPELRPASLPSCVEAEAEYGDASHEIASPSFLRRMSSVNTEVKRPHLGPNYQALLPLPNSCENDYGCYVTNCPLCKHKSTGAVPVMYRWNENETKEFYKSALLLQIVPGHILRVFENFDDEVLASPSYACILSSPFPRSSDGQLVVSAYDGSETRNIRLHNFKSAFSEDELQEVLCQCDFDGDSALKRIQSKLDLKLLTQFREREVELLLSFKKLFRDNVSFLYQSLFVQNRINNFPDRSKKDVLDFYYRFVAKEAMKFSNKLVRLFRKADEKLGRNWKCTKIKPTALGGEDRLSRKANNSLLPAASTADMDVVGNHTITALNENSKSNAFSDTMRPVICTSIDVPSVMGRFASVQEAAQSLEVSQVAIINSLTSRQPEAFGFTWAIEADEETQLTFTELVELVKFKATFDDTAKVAVECFDAEGVVLSRFNSVREAASKMKRLVKRGLSSKTLMKDIYRCCTGAEREVLGVRWRYYDSSSMSYNFTSLTDTELLAKLDLRLNSEAETIEMPIIPAEVMPIDQSVVEVVMEAADAAVSEEIVDTAVPAIPATARAVPVESTAAEKQDKKKEPSPVKLSESDDKLLSWY